MVKINLASCRHSPGRGYLYRTYSADEVDAVAAYCDELDRCYLIPIEKAAGRRAIHLRLAPARNNQKAAINFASDYEFPGAVAQLARAPRWQSRGPSVRVRPAPSPVRSARPPSAAEQFGYAYARFLQRAAAGEHFLVTRRGRPMARISPPDPPCALACRGCLMAAMNFSSRRLVPALVLTSLLGALAIAPAADAKPNGFKYGVTAAEVQQKSAIFWARTTKPGKVYSRSSATASSAAAARTGSRRTGR